MNIDVLEGIVGCASSLRPSPQTLDAHEKRAIVIAVDTRATEPALKLEHNAIVQQAITYRNVRFPPYFDEKRRSGHDDKAVVDRAISLRDGRRYHVLFAFFDYRLTLYD